MIASKDMHKMARAFGACCALFALAVCSSAAWAQAGYVHEVSGLIAMQRVAAKALAAKAVAAKVGDMFEADTVLRSGADGKVILKFADGQVVALGADSALRVGPYRYVASNLRLSASTIKLMQGEMRFVTGLIGATNLEGTRITAGDSEISIQKPGGADFTVAVNPDTQELRYAVVALGEISVRTRYGRISRIVAGQYGAWQPGQSPLLPMPFAAAPAVIQADVAALWAIVLPANTPVALAPAAQEATELANLGTEAAAGASDAIAAKLIATMLQNLPPVTEDPALAQAAAGSAWLPAPAFPAVTPGAGGGCTGSKC